MTDKLETWSTQTQCVTVRKGETQAEVTVWANSEGVTATVTGTNGALLLSGSLRYEEMEALCAAFAMVKA